MTTEAQGGKMDLGGLIRRLWELNNRSCSCEACRNFRALLDHALAMEAERDEARFKQEHHMASDHRQRWCRDCGVIGTAPDPRHAYGSGDWLARVREKYNLQEAK